MPRFASTPALCVLVAAAVLACSGGRGAGAPSVLLLTVDTLRPDYMSMNGYDRPTTPFLDELLAGGFYFDRAVAPVARTTPALASLLTGSYPHTTGVRTLTDGLSTDATTLTEVLRASGYQTLAVITNHLLGRERGLDRGFDVYDVAHDSRNATNTTQVALRALSRLDLTRPFFAWVHYIDPHVPYHPRSDVARSFDPDYHGRYQHHFGYQPAPGESLRAYRPYPRDLPKATATHRNPLPDAVNRHVRRLYAADIRSVDDRLERLLKMARAIAGGELIVVFAADHGESLGEHDFYFDHGDYVYEAALRVPLAFVLPRSHPLRGSGRCRERVSLVDVVPTLFELLDRSPPERMARRIEGRSLVPCMRGEPLPPRPVFAESGRSQFPELVRRRARNDVDGRFRAVTVGDWKLIWTPHLSEPLAWELYDLGDDPGETENRYRADHPQVDVLKAHLRRWLAQGDPAPRERDLAEPDREALRALGYLE